MLNGLGHIKSPSGGKRRAAETLLSQQLSGVSRPICITDENDEFIALNSAFAELTGFSSDDISGQNFGDLISTKGTLLKLRSRGTSVRALNNQIVGLRKKDGTTVSVEFKSTPIQVQKRIFWRMVSENRNGS